MRLSKFTDAELDQLAADCLKRADPRTYAPVDVMATSEARAAVFHELLDRRAEDAKRTRSDAAFKLAIAHIEMLRDSAIANKQTAAVVCLDMQLSLLKEFDAQ
jgi:hypothetical protein